MRNLHCPACEGGSACPGAELPGDPEKTPGFRLHVHHEMGPMTWGDRIRALLGRPVMICIDIGAGLGEFTDLRDIRELLADGLGPDDLTGPDGPWRDLT